MKNLICPEETCAKKSEAGCIPVYVRRSSFSLSVLFCCSFVVLLSGCNGLQQAREIKNAPMPPKYVETKDKEQHSSEGSLWKDSASLFEDRKAKRVNDLLTILISETSTASKTATTNANRKSTADYGLTNVFGSTLTNLDLEKKLRQNLGVLDPWQGSAFLPSASGSGSSTFTGKGDTSRVGKLSGTITAKVIEVLPNSNMVVESRKEILVNNEKEILVFRGIVRPDDVTTTNTVQSMYVADAQISLVGDGVLDDKQAGGWLVRFLDKVWPF